MDPGFTFGPVSAIPDDGFWVVVGVLVAWLRWRSPWRRKP